MSKHSITKLSEERKEAVAEQLADFFFGYWEKQNSQLPIKSKGEAIVVEAGLQRSFPAPLRR